MRKMILGSALIVGMSFVGGPVIAHSWYPKDCCHNQDCAPVLAEDDETVTTIHGTARKDTLILRPERPSKDLGDHACLVPADDYGQTKAVRCLFRGRGV